MGQTGVPPWEGIPDVRPTLETARVVGSVAEAAELAALIPLLEAAGRLLAYGRAIQPVAPDLAEALAGFPRQTELADLLRRSLDADGQVRDEASPALRRVRQRIRDLRRDLVKRLEAYFGAPNADTTFQERYVTVRHGRYVLPIRAEAKGRLRGIVHDRSQSGATLFVEPEAVVEDNNDLVQAAREEETEILRVLAALTDAVRAALPELDDLVAGIGGLDLIFARGALAERMERRRAHDRGRARRASCPARSIHCSSLASQRGGLPTAERRTWRHGARRSRRRAERIQECCDGRTDGHRDHGRAAAARDHRPQRGRQDGGAQDPGPARAHGAVRLPRARARRGAAARVLAVLRDRGRRPERGGEPLDVLRLRQAAPRGARARGRPLARAARRAGRGHRSRRRRRAGPGGAGGPGRARRGGRGLHPPRAAQGLRLHASEGPQRLGGVRSRAARARPSGSSTIARARATRSPSAPASACPPR